MDTTLLICAYLLTVVYSAFLYLNPSHESLLNYGYNLSYGLIYFFTSYVLLSHTRKDRVNRNTYYWLAGGAFSFFLAQLSWFIYNLLGLDTPYPSFADLFFMFYYLFTAYGGFRIIRAKLGGLSSLSQVIELLLLWGISLIIIRSYISTYTSSENFTILGSLLNFFYPFLDSLLVAMCFSAVHTTLGRTQPILFLYMTSFILLCYADCMFAYQTNQTIYWNGNIVDLLFSTSAFFYSLATILLPKLLQQQSPLSQLTN